MREAVDFLRYYAAEAEKAEARHEARGVIACISPWNFPLAIFTGQIAAALVTGNAVIAKPAEQTPLIAARAVELLREAGVPEDVLQLLPGDGPSVGAPLTADPRIAGVCFTGSTEVAKLIEKQLAETAAPDAMLIAETGGLNAMIVDSTALPEQAVRDILASAFQSAGQRCSALRMLYVQKDVEKKVLEMLEGRDGGAERRRSLGDVDRCRAGDRRRGAEIDQRLLRRHGGQGRLIAKLERRRTGASSRRMFSGSRVSRRWSARFSARCCMSRPSRPTRSTRSSPSINRKGYGLTFGLHTRIEARVQHIVDGIHAGNIYVNRNQIGAVVGSQPFGGEGLSGTGPKAGGPHYLRRFRKAAEAGADARAQARQVTATALAENLPDPALGGWSTPRRPHRGAAQAFARQGRGGDRGRGGGRFRAGRSAGTDGRGQHADAAAARPRALPRAGCAKRCWRRRSRRWLPAMRVLAVAPGAPAALQPLTGKGLPIAAIDGDGGAGELLEKLGVDVVAFAGEADDRAHPPGAGVAQRPDRAAGQRSASIRLPMRMNVPSASTPPLPAAMPACWQRRRLQDEGQIADGDSPHGHGGQQRRRHRDDRWHDRELLAGAGRGGDAHGELHGRRRHRSDGHGDDHGDGDAGGRRAGRRPMTPRRWRRTAPW